MFAVLLATLALSQEAITLQVDKNALGEGQQASFTIQTTNYWNQNPGRWRILGFVSWKDKAIKFDAAPGAPEITPTINRQHVGQQFALCVGVFEYGPSWQAETDAVENAINNQLSLRKSKADQLAQYAAQINAADDAAFNALQNARDQVRAIVDAGQPGAEDAVESALAAGWAAADAAWTGAQGALQQWQQLLDEIRGIEDALRGMILAGHTYYANVVQADAQALEVNFLDKETATAKVVHKVRRELLMVRPQGAHERVSLDAVPAGRVTVTKKNVVERAGNKADILFLELEGQAQISDAIADVKIRALVNNEETASMAHTNVEYRNLRLTRQYDVDDSPDDFAYDDGKTVVPEQHLVIYARGAIFPPVARAIAVRDLIDHLRIDIPVVDDSHGAQTHVKPAPRRGFKKTDKKFATIEFAESKPTPANTADKIQLAAYNGGGGTGGEGNFLFLFAYNGLPGTSKNNFGKQTVKFQAISIDGATAAVGQIDARYFFSFRKTNHADQAPAESHNSTNGIWYYSLEGAGDAASSAVPGLAWQNITVNGVAYTILKGFTKDGEAGTLGETTQAPKTVRLYGTAIGNISAGVTGYGYTFTETGRITVLNNEVPSKEKVTIDVKVSTKRFSSLVAHVWRHELRHGEQIEKQARLNANDVNDRDGDLVYNLQEMQNKTDPTIDKTWPKFPISTASAKLDQEVDCEIIAAPVTGVETNDWAMDTRTNAAKGKKPATTTRLGTQWKEE